MTRSAPRFRLDLDPDAGRRITSGHDMADLLLSTGESVAVVARRLAPVMTGAGAASIHAELVDTPDGVAVRIGWGAAQFYMSFAETGTLHQAPTPFLRPALAQASI